MRRKILRTISPILVSILCLVVFQQAVLAGPPLICHPFDIGNARSLAWAGAQWRDVNKSYNINWLVEDTLGLLKPETPVLVRMETLRRATVYAVWSMADYKVGYSVKDASVAKELLSRLKDRIPESGVKADKRTTALAMFDYGYLIESYKQAGDGSQGPKISGGVDGYALIVKAIALRGGDPEMELAAALATFDKEHATARLAHLQRAVAGAKDGSLLARNLLTHFGDKGKTLAELRANVGAGNN